VKVDYAKAERDRAENNMYRAQERFAKVTAGTTGTQGAPERLAWPRGSSDGKVKGRYHTTRYSYPATSTASPEQWPETRNFRRPGETYEGLDTGSDPSQPHGHPVTSGRPQHRNHRKSYSPSDCDTAEQTQFEQPSLPHYVVEERRPPQTDQGSTYHNEPDYHDLTSRLHSRGATITEEPTSHYQAQTPRGRHASPELYTARSLETNTSHAAEGSRPPSSSQRSSSTVVPSSSQKPAQIPVSETDTRSQRGTLGAYNTTRRESPHRERDIIQPSGQSATSTVMASQVTGALHSTAAASRPPNVPAMVPHMQGTNDTQPSKGVSNSPSFKTKPQRSRRRKPKDTLWMPSESGLEGGW